MPSIVVQIANRVLKIFPQSFKQMIWQGHSDGQVIDHHTIATNELCEDIHKDLNPETNMLHTQLGLFRAWTILTQHFTKRRDDDNRQPSFTPRENMILTETPDFEDWRFKPWITRRVGQEVSPEISSFMKQHSSQPLVIDVYAEEMMDRFMSSKMSVTKPWSEIMERFLELYFQPAFEADEYYILSNTGCYRQRTLENTRSTGGMQGTKIAKAVMRSAEAREVLDMAPLLWLLKESFGVTPSNWEDILKDSNSVDNHGIMAVNAALWLKEIEETGKSRSLPGLDEIASLLFLSAMASGSRSGAAATNFFSKGLPCDGKVLKDPWLPVVYQWSTKEFHVFGLNPQCSKDRAVLRKAVKLAGTPWGFSAQAKTISYSLCGLDRTKDEEKLEDWEKLLGVSERISHPEAFLPHINEDWSVDETLKWYKQRATKLVSALNLKLPWMRDWNQECGNLVECANKQGIPLPVFTTPDGHETHVKNWRVIRHRPRHLELKIDGKTVETYTARYEYNSKPNITTAGAHTDEGYIARQTCRYSWDANPQYQVHQVFDALYTHPDNLRNIMRFTTKSIKDLMRYRESVGWPIDNFALELGLPPRMREFSSTQVSDEACFVSA
jgi:hypothetical protein